MLLYSKKYFTTNHFLAKYCNKDYCAYKSDTILYCYIKFYTTKFIQKDIILKIIVQ